MVPRTKVARTRLTPDEHAQLEQQAKEAGVSSSEYLRGLIVSHPASIRDLVNRLESIERRLTHVEKQFAKKWMEAEDDA